MFIYQQMEDEGMQDDFGPDTSIEDSFFIEWLRDEDDERPGMSVKDENKLIQVWNHIHGIITDDNSILIESDQKDQGFEEKSNDNSSLSRYNILVINAQYDHIHRLVVKQCYDLKVNAAHSECECYV